MFETSAPRGGWMNECEEESCQEQRSCYRKAWIYPELPWLDVWSAICSPQSYLSINRGAPPSWNENHRLSSNFLAVWEASIFLHPGILDASWQSLTCLACLYIAFVVPYLAGFDDHKAEQYALFKRCGIRCSYLCTCHYSLTHCFLDAGIDAYATFFALIDLICDVMFVMDLILNFHIAYWEIDNHGRGVASLRFFLIAVCEDESFRALGLGG
eukprot:332964-Hanusia_phi.AAC.4